jgi:hypothetical protein
MKIILHIVSTDEHVPDIERNNCTIKERARCIYKTLPFKKIPACMVIAMIYASNFWLNSFAHTYGASKTLSPCAIITGMQLDYYNTRCKLEYGTYSMITQTTGAITLRPTGND